MRVRIPSPLRSYTDRAANVQAHGATLGDVLSVLDPLFLGICSRVVDEQGRLRPHMRVFINDEMVRDLSTVLNPDDEVTLMQAPSGG